MTWVFEGTIAGTYNSSTVTPVEVPELTSLGVVEGTPFIASFTIELDTPDLNPSSTFGRYDGAVLDVSFAAASYGFSFSGPSSYSQLVVNLDFQILGAYYAADGTPGYSNPLFFLEVEAAQPGVFGSDAIPTPFPAIGSLEPFQYPSPPDSAWGYGSWIVVHGGPSILVASISSHYAVPEPAAAVLAVFGVLGLAALRSRRYGCAARLRMSLQIWLVLLALGLPLPTRAATVTWVFEGTIAGTYDSSAVTPVDVPELTSLGVVEGTPFIATFTIERDTPDLDATATRGQYNEAVRGVSFAASGYGFSSSALANGSILVVNVDAQILGAYYGGPGGYFDDPLIGLEVEASEPGVFASDAIPSPFPAISALEPFTYPGPPDSPWGFGSWLVVVGGPSILVGSLTSHYVVPAPGAAPLAAFGILAVAALRSRRSS